MYLIKNDIEGYIQTVLQSKYLLNVHLAVLACHHFDKNDFKIYHLKMKLETTKKVKTLIETYDPSKAIQKLPLTKVWDTNP